MKIKKTPKKLVAPVSIKPTHAHALFHHAVTDYTWRSRRSTQYNGRGLVITCPVVSITRSPWKILFSLRHIKRSFETCFTIDVTLIQVFRSLSLQSTPRPHPLKKSFRNSQTVKKMNYHQSLLRFPSGLSRGEIFFIGSAYWIALIQFSRTFVIIII